jgi:hypothetical protein
MRRDKSEQRTICPSVEATPISDSLIARYGILNALDIARCIQEQVQAAINQQKRLHPDEWPEPSAQPSQPEPNQTKKVPPMPRIGA